jgi:hypothetical protein
MITVIANGTEYCGPAGELFEAISAATENEAA